MKDKKKKKKKKKEKRKKKKNNKQRHNTRYLFRLLQGELLANHYAKWFPRARRVEAAPHRAPTPPKGGREGNALPSRARQSTRKRPSRLDVRGPQPLPRTPGPDYPPERRVSVPGPCGGAPRPSE